MNRLPLGRAERPPQSVHCAALVLLLVLLAVCGDLINPPSAGASDGAPEVAATEPAAPTDSAIFSDGFETYGDSSLWSSEHPFPVQSDVVANGSFAARILNTGGNPVFGRVSLNAEYDRLFVRIRFSIMQLGSPSITLINLRSPDSSSVIAVRVDTSGRLSYETGATGVTSSSAVTVDRGTWHELQVLVDLSSDTSNVRMWLDNADLTTLREQVWLGDKAIRTLDLGDNSAGQQWDVTFDDIVVDDQFIPIDRPADPVPGTLVVNTHPAWENIPFELEGQIYYSGEDGSVTIPVARWSTDLRSRIKVGESFREDGSLAVFTGWKHWYTVHSNSVYAAFRISKPVTFSFVDGSGAPVDASTIDRLTIKSNSGDVLSFQGEQLRSPVLLPLLGTTFGPTGIETRTTTYVVDEVIIGGSNAVHRSQQKSVFDTSDHWTIPLLFYSVTFQSRDAFFGSALGESIIVQAADGTSQQIPLDSNGDATISHLSRGEYSVVVVGGGYSPPRPIYVSRDQTVTMEVISAIDVASLLLVVTTVVVALLIIGRPFLVTTPYRLLLRGGRAARMSFVGATRRWRREGHR